MGEPEADAGEEEEAAGDHPGEGVPEGLADCIGGDQAEQGQIEGEMKDHHADDRERAGGIKGDQAGFRKGGHGAESGL